MQPRNMKSTAEPRQAVRCVIALLAVGLVAACQSKPPSLDTLVATEEAQYERTAELIADESQALRTQQDRWREMLEQRREPVPLPPVAPAYDPLEDKLVSLNLYDTDVGRLLWALADQVSMNLIIEPAVLAQPQRSSLLLQNVTAREVYEHILDTFDLHGETRGNTLVVSMMAERIFDVELLNNTMMVDVSSGGNVFGAGAGGESGGAGGGDGGSVLRGNFLLSGNAGEDASPYDQLEYALQRILGTDSAPGGDPRQQSHFSLNRASGNLHMRARPSQIRSVDALLTRIKSVMSRQVQVEAQLIDVQLNDGFEFGVDWTLLRQNMAGVYGDNPLQLSGTSTVLPGNPGNLPPRTVVIPGQTIGAADGRSLGLGYTDDTFSAALRALRSFGSVKVLSNPSVRVRNGSPALLSVGTSARYVSKSSVTTNNPGGGATTTTADVQTDSLFAGVVVGVVPFIREDGEVELMVHPMQTEVEPGSLQLVDVGGGNRVTLPVINYKGITTTLNLHDGDTVVLGGLIDQKTDNLNRGMPGMSDVPLLGRLFDDRRHRHNSRELVIILRATVL